MAYSIYIEGHGTVKETKSLKDAVWAFCEHKSLETAGYWHYHGLLIALLDGKGKVIMEHPTTSGQRELDNNKIRKILKV